MYRFFTGSLIILFLYNLMPSVVWACACGCGVFDVETASMFPSGAGGTFFVDYDFMDQDHNWSKSSRASLNDNPDKQIKTSFINTGMQYMFDRSWGIEVELPYEDRLFKTTDKDTGAGISFSHAAVGDILIRGIYTGFSGDMSKGITFGFKVPSGDWNYPNFDRDTQIGSGSTDAVLGFFYRGQITADGVLNYFLQDSLQQPFLTQGGYLPGTEDDAAIGLYFSGIQAHGVKFTPVIKVLNTYRSRDRGWAANPTNSGYDRILISPGIELDYKRLMVYFDAGLPVYHYSNGNQLVAPVLYKISVNYKF